MGIVWAYRVKPVVCAIHAFIGGKAKTLCGLVTATKGDTWCLTSEWNCCTLCEESAARMGLPINESGRPIHCYPKPWRDKK